MEHLNDLSLDVRFIVKAHIRTSAVQAVVPVITKKEELRLRNQDRLYISRPGFGGWTSVMSGIRLFQVRAIPNYGIIYNLNSVACDSNHSFHHKDTVKRLWLFAIDRDDVITCR